MVSFPPITDDQQLAQTSTEESNVKRSRPALRLRRSPLVYTVLQVRIAPILSLKKYIPELQEALRKKGFPRYREGFLQTISFDAESLAPKIERSVRFEFYDKPARTGILITSDAVTVQTNSYSTFEQFTEVAILALSTLKQAAEVAVVERVGLRYVDWIRPDAEHSLKSLIRTELHGLDESELGAKEVLRLIQIWSKTNLGKMIVRFYQQKGQFLPADSLPINLSYDIQIDSNEIVSLLDLDHFAEQSFDFDEQAICDLAWKLHDPLDTAFRSAVTKEALQFWEAANG